MPRLRTPRPRSLAIGIPLLAMVGILGWKAGAWLGLSGVWLWVLRSVLWMLGAVLVHLIVKLFKGSGAPRRRSEPDPMDGLLEQARKRLNASGIRGRGALGRLPLILVVGPRSSAKTTFVQESRLDAEHLAGNLYSGDLVAPTELLNVWYHDDALIVEAGGPLAVDASRWERLTRKLRPRRTLLQLFGQPQAPRVAVVCVSTEELVEAPEAGLATARLLRERLAELSETIGIRLPVYVVFTKADGIPHFTEFVENLTADEAVELLGTTFRLLDAPPGTHAEREAGRLGAAFEELYQGLAGRRIEVLTRGGSTKGNGGAYEFPREFRKLSATAIPFLVELCRPSQLRVSPFLRGFYFSGVRPVVVEGEAPAPVRATAPEPAAAAGATQVFDLRKVQERARATEAPASARQRRIPQWVFAPALLRQVVLRDRVAMGLTARGFGLSLFVRASLAALVAGLVFFGAILIAAHQADRGLQERAAEALVATSDLRSGAAGPADADELERLERLRAVAEELSGHRYGRPPFRAALGMYTGDDLHPLVRRAYFDRFRPLLFERAWRRVQEDLGDLPADPTLEEYRRVYESLKAYVEVIEAPDRATASFFGPTLTERWARGAMVDSTQLELAGRQFAFLGAELPHDPPIFDEEASPFVLRAGRQFLVANTSQESFYLNLLGQWSRLPPARLEEDRPGTRGFVRGTPEVPGAFTRAAWDSVQASFGRAGELANFDEHVVGGEFYASLVARGLDPERMAPLLQARYEEEYRDRWIGVLDSARLEPRGVQGSGDWLTNLGGSRSAIFQLLSYVDSQTSVGAPSVERAFAAMDPLTAPDSLPQLFSDGAGREYLGHVLALAQAMGRLADAPGDPLLGGAVREASSAGIQFVGTTSLAFPSEPEPAQRAGEAVAALLRAPFQWAGTAADRGPVLAANQLAAEFCGRHQSRVFGRYPFNASGEDALVEDVEALLHPQDGELWAFFAAAEASGANLNRAYEAFRTEARRIRDALYARPDGSLGFDFSFQVRSFEGIDRVELALDRAGRVYTPQQGERGSFDWIAARAERATLRVTTGESAPEPYEFGGPWGVFRLFRQASWQGTGGTGYRVTWTLSNGTPLTADLVLRGVPVLDRAYLSSFTCPRSIAG